MVLDIPLIRPIGTLARMPVVDLENWRMGATEPKVDHE